MNYLEYYRNSIIEQYKDNPTGCGGSFGELLCYEIHENGLTFLWLAEKWGISVSLLGELIRDHCYKLEPLPLVNHNYNIAEQLEKMNSAPEPGVSYCSYCEICKTETQDGEAICQSCIPF